MRVLVATLFVAAIEPAWADTVVPVRTIRAQQVITPADLKLRNVDIAGSFTAIAEVAGLEAKVALYPGRPVWPADVGPPAIVERNQVIVLTYAQGGLAIRTEGRAMGRGGVGDRIKVMNLASRSTVIGQVQPDGSVSVSD